MNQIILACLNLCVCLGLAALVTSQTFAQTQTLVSVSRQGGVGNSSSINPRVSDDGRFVVFESLASDLTPLSDSNNGFDIFVRDLVMKTTQLVSVNRDGNSAGDNRSQRPAISRDGRFVTFESVATDLIATPDANDATDIFVRDLQTNTTRLVSVNRDGTGTGNLASVQTVISADGHVVAFLSQATDLVTNSDTNEEIDIFARDMVTNTTTLVSVNRDGTTSANGRGLFNAGQQPMSADGRFIIFASAAPDLTETLDANATNDVFVRDRQTNSTTLVSFDQTNNGSGDGSSIPASISLDGRYVVFQSVAANLTATIDSNNLTDVFVRDTQTASTQLVSVNAAGTASGNRQSFTATPSTTLSDDNRFVIFTSAANDLVGDDANNFLDVFRRDLQNGTTILVSIGGGTNPANRNGDGDSVAPSINRDGRFILFTSRAENFASNDNDGSDIFVRDVNLGITTLVSRGNPPFLGFFNQLPPPPPPFIDGVISADGSTVVYDTSNIVTVVNSNGSGDSNTVEDVFAYKVNTQATTGVDIDDVTVTEGNAGTINAQFAVTLSVPNPMTVTVDYFSSSARQNVDYTATNGTLTFVPGEVSKTISVAVIGDTLPELNERFSITLANPTGGATLARGYATGTIINDDATKTPASILISEFRPRGPAGMDDDFIELYNNTDAYLSLAGWGLVSVDAQGREVTTFLVGSQSPVAPRRHFLFTGRRYSLSAYASSLHRIGVEDDRGIVLLDPNGIVIDRVGFDRFTDAANAQYREGAGLPTLDATTAEHSFVRRQESGRPQDTDDNARDFVLVSTTGASIGGVASVLGAPGPQNDPNVVSMFAPLRLSSGDIVPTIAAEKRRSFRRRTSPTPVVAGTLVLRRTFTNTSNHSLTRLRFRVIDITTQGTPISTDGSTADVRVVSSFDSRAGNGTIVRGLMLEQPPTQADGGGLNASLRVEGINSGAPLTPGATVALEFRLNVVRGGHFRLRVQPEEIP